MGDVIGSIDRGFVVDKKQNIIARGLRDYLVRNSENKIVGYLNLNGEVTNISGAIVGNIQENGDILNSSGDVIAKANDLQYYKKIVSKKQNKKDKIEKSEKSKESATVTKKQDIEDTEEDEAENIEISSDNNSSDIDETEEQKSADKKETNKNTDKQKATDTILNHKAVGIAVTPGGKYIGDIYDNGYVVNRDGDIVGKETEDGKIVDNNNNEIGVKSKNEIQDIQIDEKRLRQSNQGLTVSPYTHSYNPTNVGPGGGVGPGGRYNPKRAAVISQLQNNRRQSLSGKKIKSTINAESYTGWQDNWEYEKTTISSLRVDMSNMITGDKPIPAVLARSIVSLGSAPVTAIVERNVYADSGRNVIIPAGSRIIGGLDSQIDANAGSRFNGESGGVKLEISWDRIIRPDGIAFKLDANQTADAQGRGGGALGYIDEQLIKKYGMPLASTVAASAVAYMMAANNDATGQVETAKQQAASDARDEFLQKMDEIISDIMQKKSEIEPVTFVPAGTRIIIYPLTDLWLKSTKDIIEGKESTTGTVENALIVNDGNTSSTETTQGNENNNNNQTENKNQPLIVDDGNYSSSQRNKSNSSIGAIPPPAADGTISQNQYSDDDDGDIELEF